MQWSAVKKTFEKLLAASLQGRLRVHVTEYTRAGFDIGRGWIMLDGKEIFSIQAPAAFDSNISFPLETLDFGEAIGRYLQLSVEDARSSPDVLIQGLVFLDRRLGKRSLKEVNPEVLHEFGRRMYQIRCEAEELEVQKNGEGLRQNPVG